MVTVERKHAAARRMAPRRHAKVPVQRMSMSIGGTAKIEKPENSRDEEAGPLANRPALLADDRPPSRSREERVVEPPLIEEEDVDGVLCDEAEEPHAEHEDD